MQVKITTARTPTLWIDTDADAVEAVGVEAVGVEAVGGRYDTSPDARFVRVTGESLTITFPANPR